MGGVDPGQRRTLAVLEVLESEGVDALAARRLGIGTAWSVRLRDDPERLIDEVLFAGRKLSGGRWDVGDYLIGDHVRRDQHLQALITAVTDGMDALHSAPDAPLFGYGEPRELASLVCEALPIHGRGLPEVMTDVRERITPYCTPQAHRRYLAFPDAGNSVAALSGAVLGKFLNQNLIAVDRGAPSATFVEIQVLQWLRELIGYPTTALTSMRGVEDVGGMWTPGGHLSNHIAMLTALGHVFPQARARGVGSLGARPAIVMAGPIAHYSHSDAAFHLGLGWDSVIDVNARDGYTTDPDAVEKILVEPPEGASPFMVVGVAGNCRTTCLDDLQAIGEICRRHGVWFHVDACHGGSLLFDNDLRRKHLSGIESADSVSLDPHKGLFTPYPSSYVLFRDPMVLTQFSRHQDMVLADDCWDLGLLTPFLGSRGFESLSTWMLIRHLGVERLGEIVAARQDLVRYLERRLMAGGLFVALHDVDLYRVAFVFCPPEVRAAIAGLLPEDVGRAAAVISSYTSRLNTSLYRSGRLCLDEHTLVDLGDRIGLGAGRKYTVMAMAPGNPLHDQAALDEAIGALERSARDLVGDLLAELARSDASSDAGPDRRSGPAGWADR